MTETIERTSLQALHIGGPTLRFRYGGLTWLTDPTFDEPGDYPGPVTLHKLTGPAVPVQQLGPIDVVLLSHDQHADNLDNSGRELLRSAGTVLSTPDAAERIDGVRGMTKWETATIGPVTVTAVPALHGPEGCEPVTGIVTGFVLRADGEPTVYVSGDNASVELVGEIAERIGRIDIAILFVGAANPGRFGDTDLTLNARTAVQAAAKLGDAVIVPVHAEGWAHFSETLDYLARTFGYAGRAAQLRIPPLGREVEI
ncbi:MBL fold metallo-hydrolase [Nocardia goodfellowii]|uniref:L-ascorbate metabolism protein UlaG (Beta-lactamase superfamily) n=1 Tax=Nocardia goodfellowii TaxID=882446 RepID=A0ABS4QQF0_9NOCA|nr:MBL fold metallo-hydrolase [Nocardia goodfellowii]MBP2193915.1 L-ascorbate metabolism protein UlaG (beta-lactamase superfamily) [Nocardia goodfellowii]